MPEWLQDDLPAIFFLVILPTITFIFILIFVARYRHPKPICYVYDDENIKVYEVYQVTNGFSVMGYHGYAKQANFKTYSDVEIYIRTNLYGFNSK